MQVGVGNRTKDRFRLALFARAEKMLEKKYIRRHKKLLDILLLKTNKKLPYEFKNQFIESSIE